MPGPVDFTVLRVLDANANRAREALRVLEDYTRFVLDDEKLSKELKDIRHELAVATGEFLTEAILHRNTGQDVGRDNKTDSELRREDTAAVVTAAGKRLGEALRSLEEFAKVGWPAEAQRIEKVRYRSYEIEQAIGRSLRPAKLFARVRLCVLITENACKGNWEETTEKAIRGGAECLQFREKDLDGAELLCRAKRFVEICKRGGAISIVNDRPDVAMLAGADGVHVGQDDLPAAEVRKIVGSGKIVGVSTHTIEQARRAVGDGADYIGVGPLFESGTKRRDFLAGLEYAREAAREIKIPGLGIAGITEWNVDEVIETGIRGIAVTAAVAGCDDVEGAARRLRSKFGK